MFEVKLTKVKGDVEESRIINWFVSTGDAVKKDDALLEVQTEKEVTKISAEADGVIKEIRVEQGGSAKAGDVLAIIGENEEAQEPEKPTLGKNGAKGTKKRHSLKEQMPEEQKMTEQAEKQEAAPPSGKTRIAPVHRKLANELGVDLENLNGTGRNGRITVQDIRGAQNETGKNKGILKEQTNEQKNALPLAGTPGVDAGQIIGNWQGRSQLTEMAWADVTKLEARKEKLGDSVSWTPLFGKAVAEALKNHPAMNTQVSDGTISLRQPSNLGFAIETDNGMLAAVVAEADTLSPADLHRKLVELADEARDGKLSKQESSGSFFTITNLGGYAVEFFTPNISPPETAVLGIGKIEDYLIMKDGEVRVRRRVPLSLTVDHRVIDSASAAKFLDELIYLLKKPKRFLKKKEK